MSFHCFAEKKWDSSRPALPVELADQRRAQGLGILADAIGCKLAVKMNVRRGKIFQRHTEAGIAVAE